MIKKKTNIILLITLSLTLSLKPMEVKNDIPTMKKGLASLNQSIHKLKIVILKQDKIITENTLKVYKKKNLY